MTISNKLIVLRDKHKFSQQYVADAIGVSKSTYCRFEKGTTTPGADEINAILRLYDISYEEFSGISLPLERVISYPEKLLLNLQDALEQYGKPVYDYQTNYLKYNKIKEAMEPVLAIRDEAMDFPNVDISDVPRGTTVKTVKLDMRGEKLIDECLKAQHNLFEAMQGYFDSVIDSSNSE